MEPSSYGSGSEKMKKKHKNKKHKASQAACLRHLLENMPPDSSASSSHGDVKMDTQYGNRVTVLSYLIVICVLFLFRIRIYEEER